MISFHLLIHVLLNEMVIEIRDKRRIAEVVAVILTGIGKFVFMDYFNWKLAYILFACCGWGLYVVFRTIQQKDILKYWGLNLEGFVKTFKELFPFLLFIIIGFVITGHFMKLSVLNWSIIPILIIYPVWGIIQQFIIIALLAKNLKDLNSSTLHVGLIIGLTATIFSVVHYPYYFLMIGTFFLALVYTYLFLNNRNLLVLGIFHGWLGAFFYYCILSRDTFSEVFQQIGTF